MAMSIQVVQRFLIEEKPLPEKLHCALYRAVCDKKRGSVALLLHYGVPVNKEYPGTGKTPLTTAVENGDLQMIEWLRIFGADPEKKNTLHYFQIKPDEIKSALDIAAEKLHQSKPTEQRKYQNIIFRLWEDGSIAAAKKYTVAPTEETEFDALAHGNFEALVNLIGKVPGPHTKQMKLNELFKRAMWMEQLNIPAIKFLKEQGAKIEDQEILYLCGSLKIDAIKELIKLDINPNNIKDENGKRAGDYVSQSRWAGIEPKEEHAAKKRRFIKTLES